MPITTEEAQQDLEAIFASSDQPHPLCNAQSQDQVEMKRAKYNEKCRNVLQQFEVPHNTAQPSAMPGGDNCFGTNLRQFPPHNMSTGSPAFRGLPQGLSSGKADDLTEGTIKSLHSRFEDLLVDPNPLGYIQEARGILEQLASYDADATKRLNAIWDEIVKYRVSELKRELNDLQGELSTTLRKDSDHEIERAREIMACLMDLGAANKDVQGKLFEIIYTHNERKERVNDMEARAKWMRNNHQTDDLDELAWTIEEMHSLYKKSEDVRKFMRREDWEHFQDAYMRYCADNVVDLDYDSGQKMEDTTAETPIVLSGSESEGYVSCDEGPTGLPLDNMQELIKIHTRTVSGLREIEDEKTLEFIEEEIRVFLSQGKDNPHFKDEMAGLQDAYNKWLNCRSETSATSVRKKRKTVKHDTTPYRLSQLLERSPSKLSKNSRKLYKKFLTAVKKGSLFFLINIGGHWKAGIPSPDGMYVIHDPRGDGRCCLAAIAALLGWPVDKFVQNYQVYLDLEIRKLSEDNTHGFEQWLATSRKEGNYEPEHELRRAYTTIVVPNDIRSYELQKVQIKALLDTGAWEHSEMAQGVEPYRNFLMKEMIERGMPHAYFCNIEVDLDDSHMVCHNAMFKADPDAL